MSYSKREIVEEAYAELALAGYVFDLQPEELQWGLRRLELMMATWAGKGLHVGYASAGIDESDLDQSSGLALAHTEAACLQLAKSLAAGKGKALSPISLARADEALKAVQQSVALASLKQQRMPGWMPRGAGAKADRGLLNDNFFPAPDASPVQESASGELNLGD